MNKTEDLTTFKRLLNQENYLSTINNYMWFRNNFFKFTIISLMVIYLIFYIYFNIKENKKEGFILENKNIQGQIDNAVRKELKFLLHRNNPYMLRYQKI